ncbi:hypothetical protein BZG36_02902 [Bifiguratus adelaidae]|uniref:TRP C-terminal domain-containing protein n=1 Tax=Bifiguratus adelaidae TaxID=1938954 RepID=A0A261Y1H0_9FUNG|nr:hypothetical protein BZG36_02902 [Bifiguratus adelaidae]
MGVSSVFCRRASTFSDNLLNRVNETFWTRIYVSIIVLQTGAVIILESLILNYNQEQYAELKNIAHAFANSTTNASISWIGPSPVTAPEATAPAQDRFSRLIYEDILFMCFQAFQMWFTFDAVYRQNTMQIFSSSMINFLCGGFGVIQILESSKWLQRVDDIITGFTLTPLTAYWQVKYIEICLTAVIGLFACVLMFLAIRLWQQFGWNIYKRIGANLEMQGVYKRYQLFLMLLKLNVFFEFGVSIFYLAAVTSRYNHWGLQSYNEAFWVFHAVITALLVPAFFMAWNGVRSERHALVYAYVAFSLLVLADLIVILKQSVSTDADDNWAFWLVIVSAGILLTAACIIHVLLVRANFGRGLPDQLSKEHVHNDSRLSNLDSTIDSRKRRWRIEVEEEPERSKKTKELAGYKASILASTEQLEKKQALLDDVRSERHVLNKERKALLAMLNHIQQDLAMVSEVEQTLEKERDDLQKQLHTLRNEQFDPLKDEVDAMRQAEGLRKLPNLQQELDQKMTRQAKALADRARD